MDSPELRTVQWGDTDRVGLDVQHHGERQRKTESVLVYLILYSKVSVSVNARILVHADMRVLRGLLYTDLQSSSICHL